MIIETITYEDFDGTSQTDTLHFNLTELELTEMALDLPDDLLKATNGTTSPNDMMSVIVEKLGRKGLVEFIKHLVIKSYGIRTEDGKFRKPKNAVEDFSDSMAFQTIVMQLVTDDNFAGKFFNGIIPAKLSNQIPADFQITAK